MGFVENLSSFAIETDSEISLNGSGDAVSFRFTPERNLTVSGVRIAVDEIGVSPAYLIGFQGNDGSNNPDGVWIGSQSFTDTGGTSPHHTNPINFPSNISLTSGTTYHLVVDVDLAVGSPTVDNRLDINFIGDDPANAGSRLPENNAPITLLNCLTTTNAGTTWTVNDNIPRMILIENTGRFWGWAGHSTATGVPSGQNLHGNYIEATENYVISGIEAYIRKSTAGVTGSIIWELRLASPWTSIDSAGLLAVSGDVGTTRAWEGGSFFTPVYIDSGNKIILNLKSTATGGFYEFLLPSNSITVSGITAMGTRIQRTNSTNGGTTWSFDVNRDCQIRLIGEGSPVPSVPVTTFPFMTMGTKFWYPL